MVPRRVLVLPRVLWEDWAMSGRGSRSRTSTHREENKMPNTAATSPRLPSSSRKLAGLRGKEGMSCQITLSPHPLPQSWFIPCCTPTSLYPPGCGVTGTLGTGVQGT